MNKLTFGSASMRGLCHRSFKARHISTRRCQHAPCTRQIRFVQCSRHVNIWKAVSSPGSRVHFQHRRVRSIVAVQHVSNFLVACPGAQAFTGETAHRTYPCPFHRMLTASERSPFWSVFVWLLATSIQPCTSFSRPRVLKTRLAGRGLVPFGSHRGSSCSQLRKVCSEK